MKIVAISLLFSMLACNTQDQNKQQVIPESGDFSESNINLSEERMALIKSYTAPLIIDTSFLWKDTVYTLTLKHFSSMDSGLTIPAKYNFDTNTAFTTHNFKSQLILVKQGDTVINKEITKDTFKKSLTPEFESYGTLLFPALRIKNDAIEIGYSLSIPVTDVGIPVAILFRTNGSYEIAE